MTKSPFMQPEFVTKSDLNEFADRVQEKLDDIKVEIVGCVQKSKDEILKAIKKSLA